jgi:hypothetical protein
LRKFVIPIAKLPREPDPQSDTCDDGSTFQPLMYDIVEQSLQTSSLLYESH